MARKLFSIGAVSDKLSNNVSQMTVALKTLSTELSAIRTGLSAVPEQGTSSSSEGLLGILFCEAQGNVL